MDRASKWGEAKRVMLSESRRTTYVVGQAQGVFQTAAMFVMNMIFFGCLQRTRWRFAVLAAAFAVYVLCWWVDRRRMRAYREGPDRGL